MAIAMHLMTSATRALGLFVLSLAACDDHVIGEAQQHEEPLVCSGNDTWETFGAGHIRTWCHACHSSELSAEYRYSAPVGVDFDTLLDVQNQLDESARGGPGIIEKATGVDPSMPPAGGILPDVQARFDAWIGCGAPGEGTPTTHECAGPEITGDRVVDSDAAAATLCAEGASITGTLTVSGSATIDCVCSVGGDLVVTGGAVDVALPSLTTVTGDVRADAAGLASLTLAGPLSGLQSVEGDVVLQSLPALKTMLLGELETVGGDFLVTDDAALTKLDTPRLTSVGGSVRIENDDAIVNVDFPMLEHVGVDFAIASNSALRNMSDVYDLRDVGNDLILRDNDAWSGMFNASFGKLLNVGGDLVIESNALLTQLGGGFTELETVGGSVWIIDNDAATALEGFDNLASIGGELLVVGNANLAREDAFNLIVTVGGPVRAIDNPQLSVISGLSYPNTVGGLHFEGLTSLPSLQGFGALTFVDGDLKILGSGTPMFDIAGFSGLVTVTGSVEIDGNVGLSNLTGFDALKNVGVDIVVTDNPLLTDEEAQAFADGVMNVGGVVVISGNG
jgi:hypothetical protein